MDRQTGVSGVAERLPSGRHNLPREFVVSSQRERLLDGMVRGVAENGYRTTTVAHVIKLAGVSRTTFYEHFTDKEDCFLAAYDAIVPRFAGRIAEGYEGAGGTWPERIRGGLDALLRFCAAEPEFAKACMVEVLSAGPSALERRDLVMRGMASYFDPDRPGMDYAPPEPAFVAEAVVDALYGLLYSRLLRSEAAALPGLLPQFTLVALLPYMDEARARAFAGL